MKWVVQCNIKWVGHGCMKWVDHGCMKWVDQGYMKRESRLHEMGEVMATLKWGARLHGMGGSSYRK